MNKIKDFIYRQNDIVIVLIILALAALLIYNRVTVIMDYPQQQAAQMEVTSGQDADPAGKGNGDAAGEDSGEAPADGEAPVEGEAPADAPVDDAGAGDEVNANGE